MYAQGKKSKSTKTHTEKVRPPPNTEPQALFPFPKAVDVTSFLHILLEMLCALISMFV